MFRILWPTSTERVFGGREAGIVHQGLAMQQAILECGGSWCDLDRTPEPR